MNAVCPGNLLNSPLWVNSLFKQYAKNQGISEEAVRQKYIDQVPMKRPCEYRDVTNVVVFLASEAAGYTTDSHSHRRAGNALGRVIPRK